MPAHLLLADINECTAGEHNCQQECRNTVASYQCSCRVGFTLASNGRDCNDVDECAQEPPLCDHQCLNDHGTYVVNLRHP